MDMNLSILQELVMDKEAGVFQSKGLQRVGHDWVTELIWTDDDGGPTSNRIYLMQWEVQ